MNIKVKTIRLKNKRVMLGKIPGGGYAMSFKRLEGREVITTDLCLSDEAMEALFTLYSSYANKEFAMFGFLASVMREAENASKLNVALTEY